VGLFTSLLSADTPVLWGYNQATHDKLVAEAAGGVLTPQEQKWVAEASADGRAEWIRRTRKAYGLYRFIECRHEQEIQNAMVKRGTFKCQQCQEQKHPAEAQANGRVEWMRRTRNNYGLYRFIECRHEQEIQNSNVRAGTFKCQQCQEQKLVVEASANGSVEWLRQTRENYGLYRFIECQHEQEITNSNVKRGTFKCQQCQEQKRRGEAATNGRVEWMQQTRRGCGLYRFIECRHEQEIANSSVKTGEFKCQQCQEQKWVAEAQANGRVEWLRWTRKSYGLYRFIKCRHEQEIRNGSIKTGRFVCHTCEESWATKPSNLYLHEIRYGDTTLLKFGRAQDVEHRIKGYGLPADATVVTLKTWAYATGAQADRVESLINSAVPHLSRRLARKVLTASGSTECFAAEHAALIIDLANAYHAIRVNEACEV
jgi:hypothetical protein